ncbi:MAG: hypothetical protein LBC41_16000, partial [Clostridiales bacterium]|nr:hypothetical protein [Clostridiales bacterium]
AFNHFDVFTYPLLKGESTQPREESTFDSSIYGRNGILGYALMIAAKLDPLAERRALHCKAKQSPCGLPHGLWG